MAQLTHAIALLVALALLPGCKQIALKENVQDEVSVIHQTFEKATTAVSENHLKDASKYIRNFRTNGDTILVDKSAGLSLYLTVDSLYAIGTFVQFKRPLSEAFNAELDVDSMFTVLIKDDRNSVGVKLKNKTAFYEIVNQGELNNCKNYNGDLKFSRVIFNRKRTCACYYFVQSIQMSGGRGWGMGTIVFAEKKNGKWIYLKDEMLSTT